MTNKHDDMPKEIGVCLFNDGTYEVYPHLSNISPATHYTRTDTIPKQEAVDVNYLNKQIKFHYYVMTHESHSEIIKQQSNAAYHALCDIKHNLKTPEPSEYKDCIKASDETAE